MPDDVRLLLAGADFNDPQELTERANEIWMTRHQDICTIDRVPTPACLLPRRLCEEGTPSASTEEPQNWPETRGSTVLLPPLVLLPPPFWRGDSILPLSLHVSGKCLICKGNRDRPE